MSNLFSVPDIYLYLSSCTRKDCIGHMAQYFASKSGGKASERGFALKLNGWHLKNSHAEFYCRHFCKLLLVDIWYESLEKKQLLSTLDVIKVKIPTIVWMIAKISFVLDFYIRHIYVTFMYWPTGTRILAGTGSGTGHFGRDAQAPTLGIWLLGGWLAEWLTRASVFCVRTAMQVAGKTF